MNFILHILHTFLAAKGPLDLQSVLRKHLRTARKVMLVMNTSEVKLVMNTIMTTQVMLVMNTTEVMLVMNTTMTSKVMLVMNTTMTGGISSTT